MITSDRVKSWPKKERPRERLLAEGAEKVSDADLLAVILRVGRGSSKAIAKHFAVTWAMLDRWDVTYFRSPLFNPQSNCYPNVLLSDVVQPLSETTQRVNPSESPSETFNYLGMSIPLPPLSVQKQIMVRVAAGREEIAREKASEYGGKKGKHIMIPRLRLPAGGR